MQQARCTIISQTTSYIAIVDSVNIESVLCVASVKVMSHTVRTNASKLLLKTELLLENNYAKKCTAAAILFTDHSLSRMEAIERKHLFGRIYVCLF